MGFSVRLSDEAIIVESSGWDRLTNLRRRTEADRAGVTDVRVEPRAELESLIGHRSIGTGTHLGREHPNRRRVGTMLGRGVSGKQFWAVGRSDGSRPRRRGTRERPATSTVTACSSCSEDYPADLPGHVLPTWHDVLDLAYEPWPEVDLVVDSARPGDVDLDEIVECLR